MSLVLKGLRWALGRIKAAAALTEWSLRAHVESRGTTAEMAPGWQEVCAPAQIHCSVLPGPEDIGDPSAVIPQALHQQPGMRSYWKAGIGHGNVWSTNPREKRAVTGLTPHTAPRTPQCEQPHPETCQDRLCPGGESACARKGRNWIRNCLNEIIK